MIQWSTEVRKISDLKDYDKNPRLITEKGISDLKLSLERLGYIDPIAINMDGTIIGGHARKKTLKKLGIKEIEVRVPDRLLSDSEVQEAIVRLNKNIAGEWDFNKLANNFNTEDLIDWGFTPEEMSISVEPMEGLTDEDAVPEAPEQTVTVLGDVWILGNHRLMCGDSTSIDAVEKLMAGEKADMVFTDPPYRMDAERGSDQPIGKAAAKLGEAIKHLCDFDPEKFLNILPTVFKKGVQNSYVFCNKDLVPDYLSWAVNCGYSFNILFWKKPNAIPLGGQHRPDTEYLLYFRKNATWNNAVKGANYSKCLEHGRENSTPHPTMKPVALIENQILISSKARNIILDLFGGSGSTMIACEKNSRHARLMELDPKYCDVIIKRWQEFTGKKAIHAETGQEYAE